MDNDSSNKKVVNIKDKKIIALENEITNLTNDNLMMRQLLTKAEEEIKHLKQLLEQTVDLSRTPERLILTEEEEISLLQLDRLKKIAKERQLSLDEIRAFDLLIKNKRLAQKNPTLIANYERLPENTTKEQLLAIACKDIKPTNDEQ